MPREGSIRVHVDAMPMIRQLEELRAASTAEEWLRYGAIDAGDVVMFTAPCPTCGKDCSWLEERFDAHMKITLPHNACKG